MPSAGLKVCQTGTVQADTAFNNRRPFDESGVLTPGKATQSHIKAISKPVDSQPIATPKPLQSHPKAAQIFFCKFL
jgi:hypothetical protein